MKIKYYKDFILESVLYTSDEFKSILNDIKSDSLASQLLNLINKDIKTKYNILKTTDSNDRISFIQDSQVESKLKNGLKIEDMFNIDVKNPSYISKICQSILKDNGIDVNQKDLEDFCNKFKAAYDIKTQEKNIKIVKGEDIRYWYLEYNYCKDAILQGKKGDNSISTKGVLGKSCMKQEEKQELLDIYVKNPEVCSLIIKVDDDNKLVSRALLWNTDNGKYMDRIYYTYDSDKELLKKWFYENFDGYTADDKDIAISVKLNRSINYFCFPYVDTLNAYCFKTKTLYNQDAVNSDANLMENTELKYKSIKIKTSSGLKDLKVIYHSDDSIYYLMDQDGGVVSGYGSGYMHNIGVTIRPEYFYRYFYKREGYTTDGIVPVNWFPIS
jgi:hypothetical protein